MKATNTLKSICLSLLALILLSACGTDSGQENTDNPNTNQNTSTDEYLGPAPETDDALKFQTEFWENIVTENRCGACHGADGQSPKFARFDDVNLALADASSLIDRDDPAESALITKVANGHNCWASNGQGGTDIDTCVTILTGWVENWVGDNAASTNEIILRSPQIKDPGSSKSFPEDTLSYSSTVYPLLTEYCSDCHVEGQQTPFIGSSDVDTSYLAAQSRISLETPGNSRLVQRLLNEFHNCWEVGCEASSTEMRTAIEAFSNSITAAAIDETLITSKALVLVGDGIVANSGGRYEDDVIALYEFKAGEGTLANDTSGVDPAINLELSGNVEWVGGWGIKFGASYIDEETNTRVGNGKAQGKTEDSKKLYDEIRGTSQYSIEAWVVPANVTQEDSRIVSYSGSASSRNFALQQTLYNYDFYNTTNDFNEALSTADADERLQASLQHVVATYSATQGRKLYVNGVYTEDEDSVAPGLLNGWNESFALVLGNETDGNELWEGTLRMLAIHSRALTQEQITQNYNSGVGEKFYMLFGVSHLVDTDDPDTADDFIFFEASQFDSFSYLFSDARFVSLNDNVELDDITLRGMKIAINGQEVNVGQVYQNLNISLNDEDYVAGNGQVLSNLGTIVPLDKAADEDEFFLSFTEIGSRSRDEEEDIPPTPAEPEDLPASSEIGLRTFDEINASMSVMTGVASTDSDVKSTFDTVKQQLPTIENIEGFLSAHQMAVTQLAIQYCDALVDDTSLRASFFSSFNFSENANTAFDTDGRSQISSALLSNFVGTSLDTQPSDSDINDEINSLIDTLSACSADSSCPEGRTEIVVKAACAAVLGSATTLVQ